MSDEMINQTEFLETGRTSMPASGKPTVTSPGQKKSFVPLFVVIAVIFALLIGLSVYVALKNGKPVANTVVPTIQPSEAPVETRGIRTEIAPFLQTIDQSNPESDEHPFPPINFDLRIKDPSVR